MAPKRSKKNAVPNENESSRRVNDVQKKILCEYVAKHPDMLKAKFANNVTKQSINQLWTNLKEILDKIPNGAQKDVSGWKQCFRDQCSAVRRKASTARKSLTQIGGGPPELKNEHDEDDGFAQFVPKVTTHSDPEVKESSVEFKDVKTDTGEQLAGEDCKVDVKSPMEPHQENQSWHTNETFAQESTDTKDIFIVDGGLLDVDDLTILESDGKQEIKLTLESLSTLTEEPAANYEAEIQGIAKVKTDSDSGCVKIESKKEVKTETTETLKRKRSAASHRQEASLRNTDEIIAISNNEVMIRRKYYDQKLYYSAKMARQQSVSTRLLMDMSNKLKCPW